MKVASQGVAGRLRDVCGATLSAEIVLSRFDMADKTFPGDCGTLDDEPLASGDGFELLTCGLTPLTLTRFLGLLRFTAPLIEELAPLGRGDDTTIGAEGAATTDRVESKGRGGRVDETEIERSSPVVCCNGD